MDANKIIKDIQTKHYSEIEYPIPKEEIDRAMEVFFEFCEQDDEQKGQFLEYIQYTDENGKPMQFGDDKGLECGYVKKSKSSGMYDSKEYFHFNRFVKARFENDEYNLTETSKKFLDEASKIYDTIIPILGKAMKEIDKEIPGVYELICKGDKMETHSTFRFLKYSTSAQGDLIAKGHYDKTFFTIALAESHPGLRLGTSDENLKEVIHKEKQGLLFPALAINDVTNKVLPTWHDVIQKENDKKEISTRWALVLFINPYKMKSSMDHKKTHTI